MINNPYLTIELILKNAEKVVQDLDKVKKRVSDLVQELNRIGKETSIDELGESFRRVSGFARILNEQLMKFQRTLLTTARWVSSYHIIRGLASAFGESVQLFDDFNKSLASIGAQAQLTATELERLSKVVISTLRESLYTPQELLESVGVMARAGVPVKEIEMLLPYINKLSILTSENINKVSELMISIQLLYGYTQEEVRKASNVLLYALNQSKLGLKDVADAFKYIAPAVAVTGDSFTDVMAILMTFKDVAQMSASTLGTSYRQITQELVALTPRFTKLLRQMGVNLSEDLNYHKMSLLELMSILREYGVTADKVMAVLGRRGGSSLALALKHLDEIIAKKKELDLIWESGLDVIEASFDRYKNSLYALNFLFNQLRADWIVLTKDLAPGIVQLTYAFSNFLQIIRDIASSPLFTGALTAGALLVFGRVIQASSILSGSVASIKNAFQSLSSVVTAIIPTLLTLFGRKQQLTLSANALKTALLGLIGSWRVWAIAIGAGIGLMDRLGKSFLDASDKLYIFGSAIASLIAFRINPLIGALSTLLSVAGFVQLQMSKLPQAFSELDKTLTDIKDAFEKKTQIELKLKLERDPAKRKLLEEELKIYEETIQNSHNEIQKSFIKINRLVTQETRALISKFQSESGVYEGRHGRVVVEQVKKVEEAYRKVESVYKRLPELGKTLSPQDFAKLGVQALSELRDQLNELERMAPDERVKRYVERMRKVIRQFLIQLVNIGGVRDELVRLGKTGEDVYRMLSESGMVAIENLMDRLEQLKEQLKDLLQMDVAPKGIQDLRQLITLLDQLAISSERLAKRGRQFQELNALTTQSIEWIKNAFLTKSFTPKDVINLYRTILSLKNANVRAQLLNLLRENSKIIWEGLLKGLEDVVNLVELKRYLQELPNLLAFKDLGITELLIADIDVIQEKISQILATSTFSVNTLKGLFLELKNLYQSVFGEEEGLKKYQEGLQQIFDRILNINMELYETGQISEREFGKRMVNLFRYIQEMGLDVSKTLETIIKYFGQVNVSNIQRLTRNLQVIFDIFEQLARKRDFPNAVNLIIKTLQELEKQSSKLGLVSDNIAKVIEALESFKITLEDLRQTDQIDLSTYIQVNEAIIQYQLLLVDKLIQNYEKLGDVKSFRNVLDILQRLHAQGTFAIIEGKPLSNQYLQVLEKLNSLLNLQNELFSQNLISANTYFDNLESLIRVLIPTFTGFDSILQRNTDRQVAYGLAVLKNFDKIMQAYQSTSELLRQAVEQEPDLELRRQKLENLNKTLEATSQQLENIRNKLQEITQINLEIVRQQFEKGQISVQELQREAQRVGLTFQELWDELYRGVPISEQVSILLRSTFNQVFKDIQTDAMIMADAFTTMWKTMASGFSNIFVGAIRGDI
ncbi:MAG: phage tail tape measure protein, partial [Thermofilaceae archaeon]